MSTPPHYILTHASKPPAAARSIIRSLIATLCTALILAYAMFFAAAQMILFRSLRELWQVRFFNIFGYWLYLPVLILLPLLFFRDRRKLHTLALTIPLCFFVYEYGALFTPKLTPTRVGIPLRVMTWNSYFVNPDPAEAVAAVLNEHPDLLTLQEYGSSYSDEFAEGLRQQYPYQMLHPRWDPKGFAIFSRYPLQQVSSSPRYGHSLCNCLISSLEIEGQKVTIINIHTTVPFFELDYSYGVPLPRYFDTTDQDLQHDYILEQIQMQTVPLLVVGDFNATDRMAVIQQYQKILTDSYRAAGWGFGFTFPNIKTFRGFPMRPLVRLDYIFHDDSWSTRRAWTNGVSSSDHRYVVADLVLQPINR